MNLYPKLKRQNINLSAIGLRPNDNAVTYFCTPKGARILGWAGVDGIHYCTIRGFGEMIFAVSPENLPGDHVHPIARNFEELLGLLMSCGSMDAIEQAHLWNEEQFDQYLKENPPTEEHVATLNMLREKYAVEAIDDPLSYLKSLQSGFDYRLIQYPPEYYDVDMNPAAEPKPEEWKVTWGGGFRWNKGRSGKEIPVKKTFLWGNEHWYVPAVYVCSQGLVVDFCTAAEADTLKTYIDKWDLLNENSHPYSHLQQEQIQAENPLSIEFTPHLSLNGKHLQAAQGTGTSWIPASCLNDEFQPDSEAKYVLEHYGLDLRHGWSIQRYSFLWATKRAPIINTLQITLEREPAVVHGIHIVSPSAGDSIPFTHPVTAASHTLTVHEYEAQQIEERHFHRDDMEYPTHFTAMTYTLDPDISGRDFMLRDCHNGDCPRLKNPDPNEFSPVSYASVGVIGGADGPSMIFLANGKSANTHTACSSLYFEPSNSVEWHMSFHVKTMEDIQIVLMDRKENA